MLQDLRVFFPLTLLGAWLGGCLLLSCMGWLWFGRKYRAKVRPAGKAHRVPWVKFELFGWYRNLVWMVFAPEGIYFHPPIVVRLFHPPFLLPWTSVRRVKKKGGFVPNRNLLVDIEDAEGPIRLCLSKAAQEDFFKYYKPMLQVAPAKKAYPKETGEKPEGEKRETEVEEVAVRESRSE